MTSHTETVEGTSQEKKHFKIHDGPAWRDFLLRGFVREAHLYSYDRMLTFTVDSEYRLPPTPVPVPTRWQWFVNAIGRLPNDPDCDRFMFLAEDAKDMNIKIVGEYDTRTRKGEFRLLTQEEFELFSILFRGLDHEHL